MEDILTRIRTAPKSALDNILKAVWGAYAAGQLTDEQAEQINMAVQLRRQEPISIKVRRLVRRPDPQASVLRRRRLAAAGGMPPELAMHFSTGELAALTIIASECARRGKCDLPVGKIAALSGVSESTVRNAVREASVRGWLSRQERRRRGLPSLTNIVKVVSEIWVTWISRGRVQKVQNHVHKDIYKIEQGILDCEISAGEAYHIYKIDRRLGAWHEQSKINRQTCAII